MADNAGQVGGEVLAAVVMGAAAKLLFSLCVRLKREGEFQPVGRVVSLSVFPIKSCGGVSVQSALATDLGLSVGGVTDRHWLVARDTGDFLTQRQVPQLAQVQVSLQDERLRLSFLGMPPLSLPARPALDRGQVRPCRVWSFHLEGQDCGDEAAEWLSSVTRIQGVRLLYSAPGLTKMATWNKPKTWKDQSRPGDQAGFPDNSAFHVATQASLAALNQRLKAPVTMERFRPTITIDGSVPFDEDNWAEFRIGRSTTFRVIDPCDRCMVTTVNSDKGVKDPQSEPLETLRSFRLKDGFGKSPLFGINAALSGEADTVQVGDPVFARRL